MNDQSGRLAASIRGRLLHLARERREDFQQILIRYALERLLYRLSVSEYRNIFILKGALLFNVWIDAPHRPTRDVDLLSAGEVSVDRYQAIVQALCELRVADDGLIFHPDTVRGELMKQEADYQSVRLQLSATLDTARIPIRIDIGFGDAVSPAPMAIAYHTLLDLPAPSLLAYPIETVVAEKLQALVQLGLANTRMKDFFDLWLLAHRFEFDGRRLCDAIQATFARRRTHVPGGAPTALTAIFASDAAKLGQWEAFIRRSKLANDSLPLAQTLSQIAALLIPPARAVADGQWFHATWMPGEGWTVTSP